MLPLRPYQQKSVDGASRSFYSKGNDAIILCLPTGSGKTVVFSHIALAVISKGFTVMIACHRKELIYQATEKLKKYGISPTLIMPGKQMTQNRCYVASVDTVLSRALDLTIDLLIVDECHLTKFDRLVTQYKGRCEILGATATPIRKGSQRSLHEFYQDIVSPITITQLISESYLAPVISYGPEVDLTPLQTNQLDYDQKRLSSFYHRQTMYTGVIQHYKAFCQRQGPTLVFNVSRDHSRHLVEEFKSHGILAIHIDGSCTPAERRSILHDFYHGKYEVLSNCSLLTTGYDNPRIRNVILNFATKSVSKYLQCAGRGGRPDPEAGKTHFNLIDMGSNIRQHGFWDDERTWSLIKKQRASALDVAPVKGCPQCEALIRAAAPYCPHCHYIFPVKKKKLNNSVFRQLTKDDIPDTLRKPFNEMTYQELRQYAQIKGYKPGWAYVQMKLKNKWKKPEKKQAGS